MKKQLFLCLSFLMTAAFTFVNAQSLSVTALGPQEVSTSPTINFTYTSTVSCALYAELRIANISGGVISQDYSSGTNYIAGKFSASLPAASTLTAATMSFPIPANVPPSSTLPTGKTYSWVYKLTPGVNNYNDAGSTYQYQSTSAIINPSSIVTNNINITSVASTIAAGSDLTVNFTYTAVNAGNIKVEVRRFNGSTYDGAGLIVDTYISPSAATTSTPVAISKTITIPAGTITSSALTGGYNYKVDITLYTPSYAYLLDQKSDIIVTPATTTWNGTAWSNVTGPNSNFEAIINGTYTTSGNLTAKKLTVNAGKSFTITTGKNVTVTNEVVNSGTFVIENNANLIQINNVSNTGTITVKRDSNPLYRLDYTIWSSPTGMSQKLIDFSPLTSNTSIVTVPATTVNRFYTYDTANNVFATIGDPALSTTTFNQGKGFLIRIPNTWADYPAGPAASWTGIFTGIPNNGDLPVTLSYVDAAHSYNMVGNPYASTIDATTFVTANAVTNTYIDGTLYFWRKTNVTGGGGTAYATWTTGGGVANNPSGTATEQLVPNGTIQVGQGFFVAAKAAATIPAFFTNVMRTANNANQIFRTKQVADKNRIWLNLSNTDGGINQILVAYMDGATTGVDNGIDGKYINDSATALTSNINNEEYVIQGRPVFDASDVVALNFKSENAGTFTIAKDHADGVFAAGQDIYLLDATTGTETNLQTDAYTFTAGAGVSNARFSLKYQKTLGVNDVAFDENTISVYKQNGVLTINAGKSTMINVKVFDIQGRLILEQKELNTSNTTLKNIAAGQKALLIQVTSSDNKIVTKKAIN